MLSVLLGSVLRLSDVVHVAGIKLLLVSCIARHFEHETLRDASMLRLMRHLRRRGT